MPRKLLLVGFSHHRSPVDFREKLALTPEQEDAVIAGLQASGWCQELLILRTCNRLEIYTFCGGETTPADLLQLLAAHTGEEFSRLQSECYHFQNSALVSHLFRVAAGIESQIIGETEILGQLKKCLLQHRTQGLAGPNLGLIFEKAFQAAKWARSNTGIGRGQVGLGNIVVDLATRIFGSLEDSRVLVVGSGEVAELILQSLQSRSCRDITVTGRTQERALALARAVDGAYIPFESFIGKLTTFDIAIFSTASRTPLITRDGLGKSAQTLRMSPVFFIDLAVPRDIEPAVSDLEGVFLYDIADLARIANENLQLREDEALECSRELDRRAWRCWLRVFRRHPFLPAPTVVRQACPQDLQSVS